MKHIFQATIHADTESVRNMHKGYSAMRWFTLDVKCQTKEQARRIVEEQLLQVVAIVDSIQISHVYADVSCVCISQKDIDGIVASIGEK